MELHFREQLKFNTFTKNSSIKFTANKKTFKRKIFLEGYLDNFNRNVRMPRLDKFYCGLDWIRASCLR